MMNTIYCGEALSVLKMWPNECVDCVVTSPPYWGLRDYGTATWEGGDVNCDHLGKPHSTQAGFNERYTGKSPIETDKQGELREPFKDICGKCGAKRIDQQLGLEKTPEEYIAKMVTIFREIKRVLKKEGTVWLNLGDSYYANRSENGQSYDDNEVERKRSGGKDHPVLKPKDLVGIPWRVAFALQADGWYLRQDIIWSKPNPMPESVTDRCTKSHEYIFLLAKSPKYYYDCEAIYEKAAPSSVTRIEYGLHQNHPPGLGIAVPPQDTDRMGERWLRKARKNDGTNHGGNGTGFQDHSGYDNLENPYVRNKRSVWTITTKPYPEAHFATFPSDLISPMILAGCPPKGIVLDPFLGSGTTAMVAKYLGRNYLGIELNPSYIELCNKRLAQGILDF